MTNRSIPKIIFEVSDECSSSESNDIDVKPVRASLFPPRTQSKVNARLNWASSQTRTTDEEDKPAANECDEPTLTADDNEDGKSSTIQDLYMDAPFLPNGTSKLLGPLMKLQMAHRTWRSKEAAVCSCLVSVSQLKMESWNRGIENCWDYIRWIGSRILIMALLVLKWIAMVFLAGIVLGMFAGMIFLAIFLMYSGIGLVCECQLNEGLLVLIALILLPILILLITLCCNNAVERYKQALSDGELEKCRWVYPHPEDNIVLCGIRVIEGKRNAENAEKATLMPEDDDASGTSYNGGFSRGVSRLA